VMKINSKKNKYNRTTLRTKNDEPNFGISFLI